MPKSYNDTFIGELTELVKKHSLRDGSDTPDHIIADYLVTCLDMFNEFIIKREEHYGRYLPPNGEKLPIVNDEPGSVGELILKLTKHKPDAKVEVIVHNRSYPFTITCGGGSDGGDDYDSVGLYVDELCQSEEPTSRV